MASLGRDIIKGLAIAVGVLLLGCFGVWLFMWNAFGGTDKSYSSEEVAAAYAEKQKEVTELITFFNSIVPRGKTVEIEFADDGQLFRFGFAPRDANNIAWFLDWNIDIDSDRMDSINNVLGWDRKTLQSLKARLDKAGCIQIKSGYPVQVGFKRSSAHMYFFDVFDPPLSNDLFAKYNDRCQYILVNDRLAVEFGSGVLGSQCWPEFYREGRIFPPPATPVTVAFDTLHVGQGEVEQSFVPLLAFLQGAAFSDDYMNLINTALKEHKVTMDSVWIEPRRWKNEATSLVFNLHFRSGILEEIRLEKTGTLRSGNWSGHDGILNIDKTTGKSTYLLWQ